MSGFGNLVHTGNWQWENYPPPYSFLFQGKAAPMPAPILPVAGGLGDCGCGCNGQGSCKPQNSGLGFFDSGIDYETWGLVEWGAIAAGAYLVMSLIGDTRRGVQRVRRVHKVAKAGFRAGLKAGRAL
jgi:hypothetical protein